MEPYFYLTSFTGPGLADTAARLIIPTYFVVWNLRCRLSAFSSTNLLKELRCSGPLT